MSFFHSAIQVAVNGIISFDNPFSINEPENFPSQNGKVYYSYLVAPYWSNIDTRLEGTVRYETYTRSNSPISDQRFEMVEEFLRNEGGVVMQGQWMLLAEWADVHPFPHGTTGEQEREDPYLEAVRKRTQLLYMRML